MYVMFTTLVRVLKKKVKEEKSIQCQLHSLVGIFFWENGYIYIEKYSSNKYCIKCQETGLYFEN